jgi:uncharacterized protein DUF4382
MVGTRFIRVIGGLLVFSALFGCGGTGQLGSGGGNKGNSTVVLAMTDSPASLVTILSAEVTLTGATLGPGSVSLLSSPATVELTRLQTDVAYLATASNVPAGSYTSLTLTFATPSLTIENDTASPIGTCNPTLVCKMAPTSTQNLAVILPLSSFSVASSSPAGLLVDVDMQTLLSATLGEDFGAATSVFPFTPGGTGAFPVGAEDVVGHVTGLSASNNTFTLTNSEVSRTMNVDSSTTFFQFPCATPGISCLQNNQIVSVDIGIQPDGSLLARNVVFEDADSGDVEVEGIVTSTNLGSQQFSMAIHTISGTATSVSVGEPATVQYSASLPTPFDVDVLHADNASISTSSFSFAGPTDLVPGQEVSIRLHGIQSGQLVADRVRLRSSRISAIVQSVGSSIITLRMNLPSLFSSHGGVSQIQAQTFVTPPTIYYDVEGTINSTTNITNLMVSVRGPLFNAGGTNRTLLASKVVLTQQ